MDELIERLRDAAADAAADGYGVSGLLAEAAADLEAAREDGWLTMESCPVNQRVMLWNQDEGEMFFGHKPEDAPSEDAVITNCTAAYADAWRPMPSEPESETYDGPPQLSVVTAIDQARGKENGNG